MRSVSRLSLILILNIGGFLLSIPTARADDWPQWRGPQRDGVWRDEGITETFPAEGLKYTWRVPIADGYAGPAVADGRVFVTDYRRGENLDGTERIHALDEETGETLWTREWDINTRGIQSRYANGPRATPTVDGDRVYVLGSMGDFSCLNAATGETIWQRNYVTDFDAILPIWGMTASPLVEGDLLINIVGAQPDGMVMALDKMTGEERWRALPAEGGPGYSSTIVIEAGGTRQLIAFFPLGIASLDPQSGTVNWTHPYKVSMGQTIATPVHEDDLLFFTSDSGGGRLFEVAAEEPSASLLWESAGRENKYADGLNCFMSTPLLYDGHLYGVGGGGLLRGLDAQTGERLWATHEATEEARSAEAFLVRNGDRFFINNDRGELILARLTPQGYEELSRAKLIEPTNPNFTGGRREFGAVNWSNPAYANGHVVHRNDKEIVRADLREAGGSE